MNVDNTYKEALIQGLKDSGCTAEMIERFLSYETKNQQLRFLERQRKELMDNLHQTQKMVDCIDYIVLYISGKVEIL